MEVIASDYGYAGSAASGSAAPAAKTPMDLLRQLLPLPYVIGTAGARQSLARHLRIPSASSSSSSLEIVSETEPATSVMSLTPAAQARELLAALSLNKSQLAQVLHVTRPTLYDWLDGKASPSTANGERLALLLQLLAREDVTSSVPLNARFVRQAISPGEPSLLDVLGADPFDGDRVAVLLRQARALTERASEDRRTREQGLRQLGYEELSREERRERLARNVALRDWPER